MEVVFCNKHIWGHLLVFPLLSWIWEGNLDVMVWEVEQRIDDLVVVFLIKLVTHMTRFMKRDQEIQLSVECDVYKKDKFLACWL